MSAWPQYLMLVLIGMALIHTLSDEVSRDDVEQAAPHECFVSTLSTSDPNRAECDCPKFRLTRKKK